MCWNDMQQCIICPSTQPFQPNGSVNAQHNIMNTYLDQCTQQQTRLLSLESCWKAVAYAINGASCIGHEP